VNVLKCVYNNVVLMVCVGCEAVDGAELGVESGFDGEW
jgi:hypothetical protein